MGIPLAAIQVVLGLWKDEHFSGMESVLEIGSQQLHLRFDDFSDAVTAYGVEGFVPEDFMPWDWENRGACQYADKFYKLLGMGKYACFDMNAENNAISHDLNLPFEDRTHWGAYDLVTDFGCAEHVFNVSEVFRTMHNLCRPGGIFLHCQQMYNTNGYYHFDPAFYEDLAAANGYEILFSSFIVTADASLKESAKHTWILPMSNELVDTLDWSKVSVISLMYAMRKKTDAAFALPYQEKLMSTVYGNKGYALASLSTYRRPSRVYVPMLEYGDDISTREFKRVCKAYIRKKLGLLKK